MLSSVGRITAVANIWGFGLTERFDCLDWLNWEIERCGSDIPVYLAGVSMGATTVLMAAGLQLPPNVHGIMADCGFTSANAIWEHIAKDNLHIRFGIRSAIADQDVSSENTGRLKGAFDGRSS